jgi:hypothetical protein
VAEYHNQDPQQPPELIRTVETLFSPGDVVELRMFKDGATFSGYFDDHSQLVEEAATYDERGSDVYITFNRLPEEICYRRYNRVERMKGRGASTSDKDVERRMFLFIDADCDRVAGISSTDEQKEQSRQKILEIREYLRAQGWPEPILCDSGNGYHLLYPIDLPADGGSLELVGGVLEALDFKFSDDAVKVDTTTKNAARITKFYGTTAKKGDNLPKRPHRPSKILEAPSGASSAPVDRERLEEVASLKPEEPRRFHVYSGGRGYEGFDLEGWIAQHNIPVKREGPWSNGGYKWILEECLNGHTDNSGYVLRMPSGAIVARCHHDSCSYEWREFREFYQPGAYDRKERPEEDARNESSDSSDSSDRFSEVYDFPVDAFPEVWANYIRAAAASLNCPPELVALPTLAAASGAIGRSKELLVKRRYSIPALLWLAVIAGPGEKKSPAQQLALLPSRDIQKDLRDDYRQAKEDWGQEMREHIRNAKLARKNDEVEPPAPEKPILRRILVDDITIEALALRLEENPRGFLSAQDELSGFLRGMDQYKSGGKGNARQQYLKIWSCGAITVDRKGDDEPLFIPKPFVTLQGGMQPSIVHEIADGRDDGFMDRFLFCYPSRHPGGLSEKGVPEDVEDAYVDLIRKLWEEGDDAPSAIGMSPEAKALFKSTSHELAEERWQPGFPSMLDGAWGKMETQLGRLALILSCARHALEEKREVVSEDEMRRALKLIEYFKAMARKVWGEVHEANPDDVLAERLMTVLTESTYVYRGTISNLYTLLYGREAERGETERLGKAIRRIVRRNPATLSLEEHSTGTERIIKITYEKLSEPSEPSGSEQAQEDTSNPGEAGEPPPADDDAVWGEV